MLKNFLFIFFTFILSNSVFGQKVSISVQPVDQASCEGGKVSFSVSSNAASFQWMESKDGVNFSLLNEDYIYSGTKTKELTLKAVNSIYANYAYKCVLKDSTRNDSISTDAAKIRINPLGNPLSETFDVCQGTNVDLTVTSSLLANHQYEWITPNGVENPGNVNSFSANTAGKYMVNVYTPMKTNFVCNGDFEQPVMTSSTPTWQMISNFPCWSNTAGGVIEVWQSGFMSVPAKSGKQFIELNAYSAGTLITALTNLTQGTSLRISFAHRGRSGPDKMQVLIGPTTATNAACTDLGTYATDNTAWKVYSNTFTIPADGNYTLRFVSVSSTGGNSSFGNFLDNVIVENTASLCATLSKEFIYKTLDSGSGVLSGNQEICQNTTTTFSSTIPGGTWTSSDNSIAKISATGEISGISPGTVTISYTVLGKFCPDAVSTRTLTVTAKPNAGIISGTTTLCDGTTTQFVSTSPGGNWTSTDTNSVSINAISGLLSGVRVGSATIMYTVLGKGGCSNATASKAITINGAASVGVLSGAQTICLAGTNTFTSTVTGGTWSSADPTIATINNSTGLIKNIKAGTVTMTYTQAGVNGCPAKTATRTLTITSTASAGVISGNTSICSGNTATLTSNLLGGSWSSGSTSVATINAITGVVTPSTLGNTIITYAMPSTGGCAAASVTKSISILAPISITSYISASRCDTGTVILTAKSSEGTVNWYAASSGGASLGTGESFTTPSISTTTTFYAEAISGSCTSSTRTALKASVNASPVITATFDGSRCDTGTVTIQASASTGTINWYATSTGGVSLRTGTSFTTPSISTTTTYYVDASNANCTSSKRTAVKANLSTDILTITGPTSVCVGATTNLTGSTTPHVKTPWSSSSPNVATVTNTGLVKGLSAGTSVITYMNNTGCTNTIIITVNPLDIANFNYSSTNYCPSEADPIPAISGTTGGVFAATPTGLSINPNTGRISLVNSSKGNYAVTYTTSGVCSSLRQWDINIGANSSTNLSIITSSGKNVVCMGDSLKLIAQGATKYLWNTGKTDNFITVKTPGKYTVSTNDTNCSTSVSLDITVDTLRVQMYIPSMVGFNSGRVILSGSPQEGTFSGLGVNNNTFDPKAAGLGVKKITFTYVSPNKCTAIIQQNMVVYDTVSSNCTVTKYDTVVVKQIKYDTVTVKNNVYDTVKVTKYDTITFTNNVTKYDTLIVTNNVTKYDTITVKNNVYDTLKVTKYDTVTITNNVTKYDTVKVTKFDTVTVKNNVYDTVTITNNVTKYDTITLTDTVSILKIKFKLTTGLQANQLASMSLYPNPTTDVLQIEVGDAKALEGYRYRILDALGKEVYNELVKNTITEIPLKTLGAAGLYQFEVLDQNNSSIQTNKIVLQ